MKLIGITGKAGSGKDTAAHAIATEYGLAQIALADPMKRFVRNVFDFSEEQLWGPSEERNRVDERYAADPKVSASGRTAWDTAAARFKVEAPKFTKALLLGDSALWDLGVWFDGVRHEQAATPRRLLQTIGTEWGRAQHENVWVDYMIRAVKHLVGRLGWTYSRALGVVHNGSQHAVGGAVVSDVRFDNEAEAINRAGGVVIRIDRPGASGLAGEAGKHQSEAGVTPTLCRGYVPNIKGVDFLEAIAVAVAGQLTGAASAGPAGVDLPT